MIVRRKVFLLLIAFTICIAGLLYKSCNTTNDEIKVSELPSNELWSIDFSTKIKQSAFNGRITNENYLLKLIKHAYQWDKNAMVQYALILDEIDDLPDAKESKLELDNFLDNNKSKLIDNKGHLLKRPDIFDLYFFDFMKKLADTRHAQASMHMLGRVQSMTDSPEKRKELLFYLENMLNGGYRYDSRLADAILFLNGSDFKQTNYVVINKMTERMQDLSQPELNKAINAYHACAIHGSKYCMMRMSEAYLYGVSVVKNFYTSNAWATMANKTKSIQIDKPSRPDSIEVNNSINAYLFQLRRETNSSINPSETNKFQAEIEKTQNSIVTWDYSKWVSTISDVQAMP